MSTPPSQPIVKVTFTSTTEFIAELEQTSNLPYLDKTLRVTNEYRPSSISPAIKYASVVATCVRSNHSFEPNHPLFQIIELRRYCGDIWGFDCKQDEDTRKRVEEIHRLLIEAAKECDFRVAAGIFAACPGCE